MRCITLKGCKHTFSYMQSERCSDNLQRNHRRDSQRMPLRRMSKSSHSEFAKTITKTTTWRPVGREFGSFLSCVFKAAKMSSERFLLSTCGVCCEIKPLRKWK